MLYLCLPLPFHPDHSAIIMQTPWRTAKSISCLDVLSLPLNFLQEIRAEISYLGYKNLDFHWMATKRCHLYGCLEFYNLNMLNLQEGRYEPMKMAGKTGATREKTGKYLQNPDCLA